MEIFNPNKIHPSISSPLQGKAENIANKVGGGVQKDADLQSAAQDFEAIFLHKMLESMRKTVPKSGLLESFSSDMYQSMFDEELANEMSQKGELGLADFMYKQLDVTQPKNQYSNGNSGHLPKIVDIKLGDRTK
jgi:Rod binding domain-containing protein